jgi:hypothetical protein
VVQIPVGKKVLHRLIEIEEIKMKAKARQSVQLTFHILHYSSMLKSLHPP